MLNESISPDMGQYRNNRGQCTWNRNEMLYKLADSIYFGCAMRITVNRKRQENQPSLGVISCLRICFYQIFYEKLYASCHHDNGTCLTAMVLHFCVALLMLPSMQYKEL